MGGGKTGWAQPCCHKKCLDISRCWNQHPLAFGVCVPEDILQSQSHCCFGDTSLTMLHELMSHLGVSSFQETCPVFPKRLESTDVQQKFGMICLAQQVSAPKMYVVVYVELICSSKLEIKQVSREKMGGKSLTVTEYSVGCKNGPNLYYCHFTSSLIQ